MKYAFNLLKMFITSQFMKIKDVKISISVGFNNAWTFFYEKQSVIENNDIQTIHLVPSDWGIKSWWKSSLQILNKNYMKPWIWGNKLNYSTMLIYSNIMWKCWSVTAH